MYFKVASGTLELTALGLESDLEKKIKLCLILLGHRGICTGHRCFYHKLMVSAFIWDSIPRSPYPHESSTGEVRRSLLSSSQPIISDSPNVS